jgi:hypothetical protein
MAHKDRRVVGYLSRRANPSFGGVAAGPSNSGSSSPSISSRLRPAIPSRGRHDAANLFAHSRIIVLRSRSRSACISLNRFSRVADRAVGSAARRRRPADKDGAGLPVPDRPAVPYEAERARRQYDAVEPENRLVARSLERAWEDKLRAVEAIEQEYQHWRSEERLVIGEAERAALQSLGGNLPQIWHAATTLPADRKRILRFIVQAVLLD